MARRIAPVQSSNEIRLGEHSRSLGSVGPRLRRALGGKGRKAEPASLFVADRTFVLDARSVFRGRLEVPLDRVRNLVFDDGGGWAYTNVPCRFPIYDRRADGSGTGALLGPLWSPAAALLPESCPTLAVDPVPELAPNIVLILDPCVAAPLARDQKPNQSREAGFVAVLLLRAEDPEGAREILAAKTDLGQLGHPDLEYLNGPLHFADAASGEPEAAASQRR